MDPGAPWPYGWHDLPAEMVGEVCTWLDAASEHLLASTCRGLRAWRAGKGRWPVGRPRKQVQLIAAAPRVMIQRWAFFTLPDYHKEPHLTHKLVDRLTAAGYTRNDVAQLAGLHGHFGSENERDLVLWPYELRGVARCNEWFRFFRLVEERKYRMTVFTGGHAEWVRDGHWTSVKTAVIAAVLRSPEAVPRLRELMQTHEYVGPVTRRPPPGIAAPVDENLLAVLLAYRSPRGPAILEALLASNDAAYTLVVPTPRRLVARWGEDHYRDDTLQVPARHWWPFFFGRMSDAERTAVFNSAHGLAWLTAATRDATEAGSAAGLAMLASADLFTSEAGRLALWLQLLQTAPDAAWQTLWELGAMAFYPTTMSCTVLWNKGLRLAETPARRAVVHAQRTWIAEHATFPGAAELLQWLPQPRDTQ